MAHTSVPLSDASISGQKRSR